MSLPESLLAFVVEAPATPRRTYSGVAASEVVYLRFADHAEQASAFAEVGIVAREGESLLPDFSWPRIGDISIIGTIANHDGVYELASNGVALVEVSPPTSIPGWHVNILPERVPAAVDPDASPIPGSTSTIVDGVVFLSRVTDQEYAAVVQAAQVSVQIARWLETVRLQGNVDVASEGALAAKAGLVQAGLLTAERAEIIFAV